MITRQRVTRFVTSDGETWSTRDAAYAHEKFIILRNKLAALLASGYAADYIARELLQMKGLLIALAPTTSGQTPPPSQGDIDA
jgi:hypothetical protein